MDAPSTFAASLSSGWQRDAIARISSDRGRVQNEPVELRQETIQFALSKPVFQALLEVLHCGNECARDVSTLIGKIDLDDPAIFPIMSSLHQPGLLQPCDNPGRRRSINSALLTHGPDRHAILHEQQG